MAGFCGSTRASAKRFFLDQETISVFRNHAAEPALAGRVQEGAIW
jgi:hypothetical protein